MPWSGACRLHSSMHKPAVEKSRFGNESALLEREVTMNNKTEGILSSLAAILVLFTTMLDPRVSIGLAVAFLFGLSIYHFARKS